MPHRAGGTKFLAGKGGDSSGFLPAMLERVEAERDHRGGAVGAAYTKNAALLAELVVVERMGRQHDAPARWGRQLGSGNWRAYRSAGGKCRPLVWTLSRSRCLQAPAGCPRSRAHGSAARQARKRAV